MTQRGRDDLVFLQMRELLLAAERIQQSLLATTLRVPAGDGPAGQLPVNVIETATAILIVAAVPGARADEVQVRIEDQQIVLSYLRGHLGVPDGGRVRLLEMPHGQVERRLRLPAPVAVGEVELQNGLLFVRLVKRA